MPNVSLNCLIPNLLLFIYGILIQSPPEAKYLYFRMTINGRQIVSWGIKSQVIQNQLVSHALYEPDSKWQYRDSGVVYKRDGVEKRFFHFTPCLEASAALDGGLIELRVFRSKGRRRRAPELKGFRKQDMYGITSPTGGLVESPHELTFYDWVLVDSVDSPFATFRFFYRTWTNLKALNLVSESHCEALVAIANRQGEHLPARPNGAKDLHANNRLFSFDSLDGSGFQGCSMTRGENMGNQRVQLAQRSFFFATQSRLPPPSARASIPQRSKLMHNTWQASEPLRPLPLLPSTETSLRKTSLESMRTPSVTSSLLPYVDEPSESDAFEIGVARKIILPSPSQELGKTSSRPLSSPSQAHSPSSNYDMSPPSTGGKDILRRVGRYDYIATVEMTAFNSENGNVSEGEWLRRSPSPLRRKQGSLNLNEKGGQMTDKQLRKSALENPNTMDFIREGY
ncbi:uncharacterized protein GLRG_01283 [Colletotrichum graminicola M1.001]|uniref:Integral membrane protein n=1 Tax=Colletotrichum graminicola (strain M1.001 / M2 / FGSC 10212) TaxID=645133 RepID=E3Q4X4_COLGM|nr:uncharacterized protein GLRG_01283 [Colletotrichum graminicola M1.001]EFQ26139.1 hypothetical protein GLRG_01283 [Colletotrichum graminicola M1.001]